MSDAAAEDREAFRAYLRDHNLPVTAQRMAIAEVVLGTDRHVSADEVARALDAQGARAGTATVYRTLEVLVRSGLVVERDFGEGFKRYEAARGIPHHEHLLCTACGAVTEFRDERLERMTTLLAESQGFTRQRHRLVIYGLCGACRRGAPRHRMPGESRGT
ncbi:MAG: Fur family transcriptional regulator [Gemmatimonadaceae bacterium]